MLVLVALSPYRPVAESLTRKVAKSPGRPFVRSPLFYLLIVFLLLVWGGAHAYNNVGQWLAGDDQPVQADLIVALSGSERIAKAAELYHQELADRILLTVHATPAPLTSLGVRPKDVHAAPGPRTTFEEALAAREFVKQNPASIALVVSDPYHLARVRWSFNKVFEGLDVRLLFVSSDLSWPREDWAKDPLSRFQVASEVSKMGFYLVYHGVLGRDTAPEWVFEWKDAYLGFLRRILS